MASLPKVCVKLSCMYVYIHMYGINKCGCKQKSVVGGTWACECLVYSAPFLWVVHICAREATASCSYVTSQTHNLDVVSAKRPCYQVILLKSSSSPFRYVLRVKTQIVAHLQNVISIIHSIQSTWFWKVWILVWIWLWLRAYVNHLRSYVNHLISLNSYYLIYRTGCFWFTMPYFSQLLWTATLVCLHVEVVSGKLRGFIFACINRKQCLYFGW